MTLLPPPSLLETETSGDGTVVHINEVSLGKPNIHALDGALTRLADAELAHRGSLHLAEAHYISCLDLAPTIRLHRKLKQTGGHLTLLNLHPFVYEVFEVTPLTSILDVRRLEQEVGA